MQGIYYIPKFSPIAEITLIGVSIHTFTVSVFVWSTCNSNQLSHNSTIIHYVWLLDFLI